MLARIRQVISAITAQLSEEDKRFIEESLTTKEQALFYAMNLPDQRHALNVAYTAMELAKDRSEVDKTLLLKSALLHDVGKVRGDVSTWDKIITVLAHNCAPNWARNWGKRGRGGKIANLRHAFHTYYHHPARSAELLAAIGEDRRVGEIVRRHHEPPAAADSPELAILRQADELH